jgi:hypothetical protein
MSVQVVVTALSGNSCTISAKDTWTVDDLKTGVRDCMHIHAVEQRLIFGTTVLEGHEIVSSLQHQAETEDNVLHLTLVRLDENAAEWLSRLRISCHYTVFREAPDSIRNSHDMVLAAVCAVPNALWYAAEQFRYDYEIVMKAVCKDASIFEDLPEPMRGIRDIAKAAVHRDGRHLEFAEKFHSDLELVGMALTTHANALWLCPQVLWTPELVLQAVNTAKKSKYQSEAHGFVRRPELQALFAENEFMLAAVDKDPMFLQYALGPSKMNREIVSRAVGKDWHALEHAANELKSDREIVCMALAQSPLALQFADSKLKDDTELVRETVSRDAHALKFASRRLQRDDVISAVAWYSLTTSQ